MAVVLGALEGERGRVRGPGRRGAGADAHGRAGVEIVDVDPRLQADERDAPAVRRHRRPEEAVAGADPDHARVGPHVDAIAVRERRRLGQLDAADPAGVDREGAGRAGAPRVERDPAVGEEAPGQPRAIVVGDPPHLTADLDQPQPAPVAAGGQQRLALGSPARRLEAPVGDEVGRVGVGARCPGRADHQENEDHPAHARGNSKPRTGSAACDFADLRPRGAHSRPQPARSAPNRARLAFAPPRVSSICLESG